MKRNQFLVLLFLLPLVAVAKDRVEGDINCDGKIDVAEIAFENKKVNVIVTLNNGEKAKELIFGVGDTINQNALCDNKASLEAESLTDISDIFGENPVGYKASKTCIGVNLKGGECDSIHIFWNHKTNQLDWWRL